MLPSQLTVSILAKCDCDSTFGMDGATWGTMAAPTGQGSGLFTSLPDHNPTEAESRLWTPHRIGSRFDWLDHDRILVIDGPLSERQFEITTDIRTDTAVVRLRENGHFAGQVQIDRVPSGRGVVLSNAIVDQRLRRGGLAAIMTWCAFRELLTTQESATFRIRMAHATKAGAADNGVRSIGMGVIAARLGFRTELPIEDIARGDNITGITAMPGDKDNSPALKILLRSFPSVLVAHVLSPATMKPISDYRTYLELKQDGRLILTWLRQGLLFVNGGYRLSDSGIERFVNALATDEEELAEFRSKVRAL